MPLSPDEVERLEKSKSNYGCGDYACERCYPIMYACEDCGENFEQPVAINEDYECAHCGYAKVESLKTYTELGLLLHEHTERNGAVFFLRYDETIYNDFIRWLRRTYASELPLSSEQDWLSKYGEFDGTYLELFYLGK